jgi:hypothetical protein
MNQSAKRRLGVSVDGRQERGRESAALGGIAPALRGGAMSMVAFHCAALLAAFASDGCGPQAGPGLEPPSPDLGAMRGSGQPVGAPIIPGPNLGPGGWAGSAAPIAGSGAADAGISPPTAEPMGSAGTGTGASDGDPLDSDAGTDCEIERSPALGLERLIAPWTDGGLFDEVCMYELPDSAAQYLPDRVNLQHTYEGQSQNVARVDDMSACDPVAGGFYYDDPQNPTWIIACEATCARFGAGGEVTVVLGCPTATR